MAEHLMLVSLGPVQDMIASARRSRDLWFGSWLLSELSRHVGRALVAAKAELITPTKAALEDPKGEIGIPNQLLAIAPDEQSVTSLGQAARQAIDAQLERLWRPVQRSVRAKETDPDELLRGQYLADLENAAQQVFDLISLQWVALSLPDRTQFPAVRKRLYTLLEARKQARTFQQPAWSAPVPKSSISGQLESVIDEDLYPNNTLTTEQREEREATLYDRYHAGRAERLSGVDLLKRLGRTGDEDAFPSTSHIAAGPLLALMRRHPNLPLLNQRFLDYIAFLEGPHRTAELIEPLSFVSRRHMSHPVTAEYDASVLFEERLRDHLPVHRFPHGQQQLRDFLGDLPAPSPYYALLLADGDDMGDLIDAQKTIEAQQQLTGLIEQFSKEVKRIVEVEYAGALVYAGGDDVLAFLPLHTAVECAQVIAERFRAIVGTDAMPATMSAGIAITHHIEPLYEALRQVASAEKRAKKYERTGSTKKNSLAITLDKRSGAPVEIVLGWEDVTPQLLTLAQQLRGEEPAIPHGTAHELRALAVEMGLVGHLRPRGDSDPLEREHRRQATRLAARAIVGRKRSRSAAGFAPVAQDSHTQLTALIASQPLPDLAHLLIVAELLADALDLAQSDPLPRPAKQTEESA